jgi:hypothetical protein
MCVTQFAGVIPLSLVLNYAVRCPEPVLQSEPTEELTLILGPSFPYAVPIVIWEGAEKLGSIGGTCGVMTSR